MEIENVIIKESSKFEKRRKDKSDIATVDKVLDPKTINILNQLIKRGKLFDLCGSFSCGKEANIYTAKCSTSLISKFTQSSFNEISAVIPVVLKIYKTSTMLFKDRTRYIIDEKRFKKFCKSNSRKLIKVWSEKEVRNLKRLIKHNIMCPKPLYLKKSILIMTMIGNDSPAPKLKDAKIESLNEWTILYEKCVQLIIDMYQKAKLIHADFSEYNLIYYDNNIYVIDVSQAMDINQENSNTFLVMDICNCNEFFMKKGVKVESEIDLFEKITKLKVPEYLKINGKLNKDSFIPTRIVEVANKEDLSLFLKNAVGLGIEIIGDDDYNAKNDLYDNLDDDLENLDDDNLENIDDEDLENIEEENRENIEEEDNENIYSDNEKNNNYDLLSIRNYNILGTDLDNDESSVNIDSNEIENIEEVSDDVIKIRENTEAHFILKSFADLSLDKINIYCRRLRLKNPYITKEEERAINKQRKAIVKQMNRERRIARVNRKEEHSKKTNKNKNTNSINK